MPITRECLIPIVEDKAVNAEDQITFYDEEPGYKRKQDTHRERERERGTKSMNYIHEMQQLQNNNNQPLLKVTKSLYIVTNLGQLPFMLFTQMARTWAIKEDSVNTSIIHWYSTLPRNGRIHG